jgi:hypothetical protein
MPLHGYTTDRRPPTNRDHLYAHPYSILVALFQILAGIVFTMASLLGVLGVSQSLQQLPALLLLSLSAMLVVGGVSIIRGLLDDSDDLMVGWKIERTGLILSATSLGVFAFVIFWSFPKSVTGWGLAAFLAAAHLIRLRATVLEERRVRTRVEEHATAVAISAIDQNGLAHVDEPRGPDEQT